MSLRLLDHLSCTGSALIVLITTTLLGHGIAFPHTRVASNCDHNAALGQAMHNLLTLGYPPPNGYDVTFAQAPPHMEGIQAYTDTNAQTITLFLDEIGEMYGEGAPCDITLLMAIIRHEYHHAPIAEGGSSWGGDECSEIANRPTDLAQECETICEMQAAGAPVDIACDDYEFWYQDYTNNAAGYLLTHDCPGVSLSAVSDCPCCP